MLFFLSSFLISDTQPSQYRCLSGQLSRFQPCIPPAPHRHNRDLLVREFYLDQATVTADRNSYSTHESSLPHRQQAYKGVVLPGPVVFIPSPSHRSSGRSTHDNPALPLLLDQRQDRTVRHSSLSAPLPLPLRLPCASRNDTHKVSSSIISSTPSQTHSLAHTYSPKPHPPVIYISSFCYLHAATQHATLVSSPVRNASLALLHSACLLLTLHLLESLPTPLPPSFSSLARPQHSARMLTGHRNPAQVHISHQPRRDRADHHLHQFCCSLLLTAFVSAVADERLVQTHRPGKVALTGPDVWLGSSRPAAVTSQTFPVDREG